ncbi:thiopeptide-type bacteriocin biosynthesis protein [uncultured Dokdonia sp.]|uniref:thiopeptide-type bacteriocin biosynthesis protein n=1 Tax=uncultured Dokdonia sp. TaxID=575653 RepID=UPI002605EDE9|nr:thiopeptide-type bacteriocin biosynthesis protein [uncultured Dokdonia sp.]
MPNTQRTFIPGDSWVYYKIYTGTKTADIVLAEAIKPITEELFQKGHIDQWFFIRYADPKHHIRVRFHYKDADAIGVIMKTVYAHLHAFAKADLIWKIQLDTYNREIERYGEEHIEAAEQLFSHESDMIVNFLDMVDGEEGEELRWLFSIRALDTMLADFDYSEDQKLAFMERLKTGFGQEFGMNKFLKKQLDEKFRSKREKITFFIDFKAEDRPEYQPLLELLAYKSEKSKTTIEALKKSASNEKIDAYLGSYAHMLMNRMFRSKNRLHEMVVYDLLYRHYKVAWGIRTFKNKKK